MAILSNGILKYNLPTATQLIVKGSVIVIMVIFDSVYNNYMEKKIQQKSKLLEEASVGGDA
jgi:ribose transport system permease protein